MERRKPITEEDILLTELLLARSFENLKKSVVRTSTNSLKSVGGSLRRHPFAVAGTAAGAGVILYGLYRLMNRSGPSGRSAGREPASRRNMSWEIVSMLMPVIIPYITAYAEKYLGRKFSGNKN